MVSVKREIGVGAGVGVGAGAGAGVGARVYLLFKECCFKVRVKVGVIEAATIIL